MSKRLIKVAKELNVGTATIIDHLHKNGFDIENRPTAKVSEEMYNVLLRDFQKSIAIKEKADKLNIGSRKRKEAEQAEKAAREAARLAEAKRKEEERKALEAEKQALLERRKREELARVAEEKKKREEELAKERAAKSKLAGVKLVKTVDIDKKGNIVKDDKEAKVEETELTKKKVVSPTNKSTSDDKKNQKEIEKKETPPAQKEMPMGKSHEETLDPDNPNVVRAETPTLKGLKIKGKIDLNRFNKRPTKKKEKDSRSSDKSGQKSNKKREIPKDKKEVQPGEKDRKRPQPIASSEDSPKKRKRKRKKIIKPDEIVEEGTGNNTGGNNNSGGNNRGQELDLREIDLTEEEETFR